MFAQSNNGESEKEQFFDTELHKERWIMGGLIREWN
jgi:hypothetical protein